jgi:hypothetical protein
MLNMPSIFFGTGSMAGSSMPGNGMSKTVVLAVALGVIICSTPSAQEVQETHLEKFATSDKCIACHSNLFDAEGNDVSIGHTWRSTMMAHSAKDPYWHAAVRREIEDHPEAQAAIEDKCSTCHMPMARTISNASGRNGKIFDHLGGSVEVAAETALARDGVSCTACHQIKADNFGEHSSFDGGFLIDMEPTEERQIFGPFDVDAGRRRIMKSASDFTPGESPHVQRSELCATCHTLFTNALDDAGNIVARFPEQVPYLEWRHSSHRETQSCQDCHMPEVSGATKASSVLGELRENVSQHAFRGGNAFMLGILNRYRDELGVTTPAAELEAAVERTKEHLSSSSATLDIESVEMSESGLSFEIKVRNLAGHKLPTAYPSRRVWIHVQVKDDRGAILFESGAPRPDGSIVGNDNDRDGATYEPHYDEIVSIDQVQIYEPVILDFRDQVTTGLLYGVRYAKDNRLLPSGFEKSTADSDVAVRGAALNDDDFYAGQDSVRYRISFFDSVRAVSVLARLIYQPIGYRWAQNLKAYDSFETNRFFGFYEENAAGSTTILAESRASAP